MKTKTTSKFNSVQITTVRDMFQKHFVKTNKLLILYFNLKKN